MLVKEPNRLFLAGPLAHSDQLFLWGHGLGNRLIQSGFKAKITAGHDADEVSMIDDRNP